MRAKRVLSFPDRQRRLGAFRSERIAFLPGLPDLLVKNVSVELSFAMSEHKATISWADHGPDFLKGRYSREHSWTFDGGVTLPASPSPHVVPAPYSNPAHVDPEEAYVAAIASCHMLTFLFLAAKRGIHIVSYRDEAVGTMAKSEGGTPWVAAVVLRPRLEYAGERRPSVAELDELHHQAHAQCFIANSVKTHISVE